MSYIKKLKNYIEQCKISRKEFFEQNNLAALGINYNNVVTTLKKSTPYREKRAKQILEHLNLL